MKIRIIMIMIMTMINNHSTKICSVLKSKSLELFRLVIFVVRKYRVKLKLHHQIRSNIVKSVLKSNVDGLLTSKYQVYAGRLLCFDVVSKEEVGTTRHLLESLLEQNPHVSCFFSCIAALSEGKHENKNRKSINECSNSKDKTLLEQSFCLGISLWIVFNWSESGLTSIEKYTVT